MRTGLTGIVQVLLFSIAILAYGADRPIEKDSFSLKSSKGMVFGPFKCQDQSIVVLDTETYTVLKSSTNLTSTGAIGFPDGKTRRFSNICGIRYRSRRQTGFADTYEMVSRELVFQSLDDDTELSIPIDQLASLSFGAMLKMEEKRRYKGCSYVVEMVRRDGKSEKVGVAVPFIGVTGVDSIITTQYNPVQLDDVIILFD